MGKFLTNDAWQLEASSKIDVLEEPSHTHLIMKFLGDQETGIERNKDSSYVLYGNEEAVLVIPSKGVTRLLLFWIYMIRTTLNYSI